MVSPPPTQDNELDNRQLPSTSQDTQDTQGSNSRRRRRTLDPNGFALQQFFAKVAEKGTTHHRSQDTDQEPLEGINREREREKRASTTWQSSLKLNSQFRVVKRPNSRKPRTAKKPNLSPHTLLNNLMTALPTFPSSHQEPPEDIPVWVRDHPNPRTSTVSDGLDRVLKEFTDSPLPNVKDYFSDPREEDLVDDNEVPNLSLSYNTTGELMDTTRRQRLSDLNNVSLFSSSRDSLRMELDDAFNTFKQHTPESIGRISDVNLSISDSSLLSHSLLDDSRVDLLPPHPHGITDSNPLPPSEVVTPTHQDGSLNFPDPYLTHQDSSLDFPEPYPTHRDSPLTTLDPTSNNEDDNLKMDGHDVTIDGDDKVMTELGLTPHDPTTNQIVDDTNLGELGENLNLDLDPTDHPNSTQSPTSIHQKESELIDHHLNPDDSQLPRPPALDLPELPHQEFTLDNLDLDPATLGSQSSSSRSSPLNTPSKYSPTADELVPRPDDLYHGFDPFSLEEDPFLASAYVTKKPSGLPTKKVTSGPSLLNLGRTGFTVKSGVPRVTYGRRRRTKQVYKTRSGTDCPNLPDSLLSELAEMSLRPGAKGPRLSPDCLDSLHHATFRFFQQTSHSLGQYARQAHRSTIMYPDTERLLRSQGILHDRNGMLTLLAHHLPQELVQMVDDRALPRTTPNHPPPPSQPQP